MFLFKYGRREHLEPFVASGANIQVGTVYSYDEETHGPRIGDDREGLSDQVFTDESTREMVARGDPLPTIFGMPAFGAPGTMGNVVIQNNIGFNYAIYCTSRVLHKELCKEFDENYDCAIVILRPFFFFHEVTKAFEGAKISDRVKLCTVEPVHYRSREIPPDEGVVEALIKESHYASQAEVRCLWNIGDKPSDKFYRFDVPAAVECCRLIPFDLMPDYEQGASPEVHLLQVDRALKGSAGRGR